MAELAKCPNCGGVCHEFPDIDITRDWWAIECMGHPDNRIGCGYRGPWNAGDDDATAIDLHNRIATAVARAEAAEDRLPAEPAKGGVMESTDKLYSHVAASHPKLSRGQVWCLECGRMQEVVASWRMQHGWPTCCGYTMSLDSPDERAALAKAQGGEE